jgi:hypothetical protein
MFRLLLEICIFLVVVPFLFLKVVWPLWKGQKIFPIFEKKNSTIVEDKIKDVNEEIETEEEKLILKQKQEQLSGLKKEKVVKSKKK